MRTIKKYKYLLTILIVISLAIVAIYNKDKLMKKSSVNVATNDIEIKNDIESFGTIRVDIKGAIKNPGVYEVEDDTIVNDVIEKAGGLLENADTTIINLAKKVTDGDIIIIYTKEEVANSNIKDKETVVKVIDQECVCPNIQNDGCINDEINDNLTNTDDNNTTNSSSININTASKEELMNISGIGESKANAIIEYRTKNGKFKKIEDIMNVSGIGQALYEKIKEHITV